MLISYNWLQSYFKNKLPPPESVSETLIFHAFEVESVEKKGNDMILNVKILPDRAHDCLSHRGIARELAVHLDTPIAASEAPKKISKEKTNRALSIKVDEEKLCRRYLGRVVEGVKVGPSPEWLVEKLTAIGQKSINNIVDATNYVMFDIGQPLHAFDADKVSGKIIVRKAKEGERITTLDKKDVLLDTETLIIADDEAPLAIAGIKGGTKAEITSETTSIILEAANFAPVNIRKTSRRLGIQTDSSKRFENERSPEGLEEIMETVTSLIVELEGNNKTKVGDIVDVYPHPLQPYKIGISVSEVNNVLGTTLTQKDVLNILKKLNFEYELVKNPIEKVLEVSRSLLGSTYKRPSAMQYDAPKAFSCTSLISYAFVQAGIYMPSLAIDKYVYGTPVENKDLKPGDIIFVNTNEGSEGKAPVIYYETIEWMKGTSVEKGIDHAGIYLGNGEVLHTSWKQGKAIIEKIETAEQFNNIVGYRRFIDNNEERFVFTIPHERLDLRLKEDLIEEIGRTYGYKNIKPKNLSLKKTSHVNKEFYYINKIRNMLATDGFSEIYTSSFENKGELEVLNPIAKEKEFLRHNLTSKLLISLDMNNKNLPLLGMEDVRLFEIGNTFSKKTGEILNLAFGIKGKNSGNLAKSALENLSSGLGVVNLGEKVKIEGDNVVLEIELGKILEKLPLPPEYEPELSVASVEQKYQKISPYPFVGRDIALFVPPEVSLPKIIEIIKESAGNLLIREPKLFDRFEKKNKETEIVEKISFAFRLVFQSQEKTLSDDEVNVIIGRVTKALNGNTDWQVR